MGRSDAAACREGATTGLDRTTDVRILGTTDLGVEGTGEVVGGEMARLAERRLDRGRQFRAGALRAMRTSTTLQAGAAAS